MFGFGVNVNDVVEYQEKAIAIEAMMAELAKQGLIAPTSNNKRICNTNYNNITFLTDCLNSGQMPGKAVFWAVRKTVDINLNTVQSMVNRLKPEFA